jgi:archaellum component FlaF (FlaF/FlaG flagellin family)
MKTRINITFLLIICAIVTARAQQYNFTIKEAIDYAIKHNINIKNTELDAISAESRIGEIRAE